MAPLKKLKIKNDTWIKLTISTKGIIASIKGKRNYTSFFPKGKHITDNVHINDKITLMTLLDNARIGKKDNTHHKLRFINENGIFITFYASNACLGLEGITLDCYLDNKKHESDNLTNNRQLIPAIKQNNALSKLVDLDHKTPFIASELREPINAIIGFTDLLLEHSSHISQSQQQNEYIQNIKNSSNHLLEILNTYSQHQEKTQNHQNQDIDSIITQAIAMTTHLTKTRKVIFTPSAKGSYYSSLKSVELKQILINLIHNATTHSEEDSIITIQRHILKNNNLLLTISDTGINMAVTKTAKQDQPFKLQENALSNLNEENNIGLSFVFDIVKSVKGIVSISNKKKSGTIVSLIIPLGHNLQVNENINNKRNNTNSLHTTIRASNQSPSAKLFEKYLGNGKNKQKINKTA